MLQRFETRSRSFCTGVLGLLLASALGCASFGSGAAQPTRPPAVPLDFSEFFVRPVGPRGLEPTPRLLTLNGQRVRIEGFMVSEEEPYPGLFLLTPFPVALAERSDGPADYLPAATLYVHAPEAQRDTTLPHRRERLVLTGTLDLGAREEANGRFSTVRLLLEELPEPVIPTHARGAIE